MSVLALVRQCQAVSTVIGGVFVVLLDLATLLGLAPPCLESDMILGNYVDPVIDFRGGKVEVAGS